MGSDVPIRIPRPAFRWAGVAILVPVFFLAAAGAFVLWRDHRAAERDLRDRARVVADEAARAVVRELTRMLPGSAGSDGESEWWLAFDAAGRLREPVFAESPPTPAPVETGELSTLQTEAWQAALASSAVPADQQVMVWEKFLETGPPPRFAALAELALAAALRRANQPSAALARLSSLHPRVQREFSEAGLPLSQWVALEWFLGRAEHPGLSLPPDPMGIYTNPLAYWRPWLNEAMVRHPTLLSSRLAAVADAALAESAVQGPAGSRGAVNRWRHAEHHRALAVSAVGIRSAGLSLSDPLPPTWRFLHDGQPWLALRSPVEVVDSARAGTRFRLLSVAEVAREAVDGNLAVAATSLPYTTVTIQLGGQGFGRSGGSPARLAESTVSGAPWPVLAVVWLQDAEGFYAALRERTALFSLLIALAAVSAVVGFVAARRAFARQERLALMKSNFVSSVSHELRAPLASVRLMAEGLARGTVTDRGRQAEYHQFIVQECRRLSALIDNVLDFARIEQGRKEYEFASTDLVALVAHTLHLLEPVAAERGVRLVGELPPAGSLEGDVDGQAVQQALINLLDNAIKYSPAGGRVSVLVNTVVVESSSWVRVAVTDGGPGIPREEHERIFERFYRVGSEMRRETQGVGIGLSIVQHIAGAHGGRVQVDSAPGRGSTFCLELPLTQPPMAAPMVDGEAGI